MDALVQRAIKAYHHGDTYRTLPILVEDNCSTVEHDGFTYVVLRTKYRIAAVYRHIARNDELRKMKRWPRAVTSVPL